MEIRRDLVVPGRPADTFDLVDDLEQYPTWMTLVHAATATTRSPGDAVGSIAWIVELQAQVGPFARSKQLRMVRTLHAPATSVTFERAEVDGRSHSPWTLHVELSEVMHADPPSTRLTMTLTYGGRLWTGAVLQRVLDDEVERASVALLRLVTDRAAQ